MKLDPTILAVILLFLLLVTIFGAIVFVTG